MTGNADVTVDDLLSSLWLAFGPAEYYLRIREETGVSYFVLFPHLLEPLGPLVEKLAGS